MFKFQYDDFEQSLKDLIRTLESNSEANTIIISNWTRISRWLSRIMDFLTALDRRGIAVYDVLGHTLVRGLAVLVCKVGGKGVLPYGIVISGVGVPPERLLEGSAVPGLVCCNIYLLYLPVFGDSIAARSDIAHRCVRRIFLAHGSVSAFLWYVPASAGGLVVENAAAYGPRSQIFLSPLREHEDFIASLN